MRFLLTSRLMGLLLLAVLLFTSEARADQMQRGAVIYAEKCLMCHQASGQGAPPIYPPLAESDWMLENRARAIKVLAEGLTGTIVVKGQTYSNAMPAQVLNDEQVADVLTYVFNSWGNQGTPFTIEEVRKARATSRFKTYDALVHATAYQPLPQPPEGWTVREVVQLPEFCTRMASDGKGSTVYLLQQSGGVYALDLATAALQPIIKQEDYLDSAGGSLVALGCTVDAEGRLWIVTNQKRKGTPYFENEVVIWRSSGTANGHPTGLQPWFKTRYPHGIGGFNHGASHIAFGPDGMLYVSSGSRTDGGEGSRDPKYWDGHEVEVTACLWRLDPRAEEPKIEVLGHGVRNAYGFAWDGEGNLFSASNGPDASAAEELDHIVPGRHYGFPYQFADWPVKPQFPYDHTPPPPLRVEFKHPVVNLGPAGGGKPDGLSTFDPHSSPGGMIWCGEEYPEPLRGRFLIPRFGNLLGAPAAPEDVGFDLLTAKLAEGEAGNWTAEVQRVLAPLGRPLDVHAIGGGRVLILEYTRPTNFKDRLGWLPGRIIELAPRE